MWLALRPPGAAATAPAVAAASATADGEARLERVGDLFLFAEGGRGPSGFCGTDEDPGTAPLRLPHEADFRIFEAEPRTEEEEEKAAAGACAGWLRRELLAVRDTP